jgi:hypothetical protein
VDVEHKATLTYLNSDDGVWLECSCRAMIPLGFFASPADAVRVEAAHLAESA